MVVMGNAAGTAGVDGRVGVVDPAIGAFAADLLPQGRLVGMAGCGHAPFLEKPAEYQSTLLEFLRGLS